MLNYVPFSHILGGKVNLIERRRRRRRRGGREEKEEEGRWVGERKEEGKE